MFHILTLVAIYTVLALSLDLLVGYTGLLSLCHAAFFGAGAYAYAILSLKLGINMITGIGIGAVTATILSLVVSLPSIKLKGDYFVLAALGFQIIVYTILYNWVSLTRGPYGLPGIPRNLIFGLSPSSVGAYFLFTLCVVLLVVLSHYMITHSPFGMALKVIREDELSSAVLGKNIPVFKIKAFALAAGYAGIAGVLFAGYMRYVDPTSFSLMESVFILSLVIIGGAGNFRGPILGAAILIVIPEALRFLKLPENIAANLRQIFYGLMLVLVVRYRPQGFCGEYELE